MPVLAALLSSSFGALMSLFAARMSIAMAASVAFVAVMLSTYVAVKAAIAAVAATVAVVVAPAGVQALSYIMPGNIGSCLTAIILADAIATSFDYWKHMIGAAVYLARG